MIDSTKTFVSTADGRSSERASEAAVDSQLVDRIKEGDINAFNQIVHKYRERLYSTIYNMTSNSEDAAELTQDAFIKAFRSIHKFNGKSKFFTWLYKIALYNTINHIKKRKHTPLFSLEDIDENNANSTFLKALVDEKVAENPSFLKELQEKLNESLQSLSVNHRTVVVLHNIEGLSLNEIAEITGTSLSTVKSRLHHARNDLKKLLKDYIQG